MYNSDLVIDVLTGGVYVGREMIKSFDGNSLYTEVKYNVEVQKQRTTHQDFIETIANPYI